MRIDTEPLRDRLRPLHRQVASALPVPARRHYLYASAMGGRPGNFRHPRTFNEKINWRILNDRRQIVAEACDKLQMKVTARARLGEDRLRIPETFWSGTDLDELDPELLRRDWVLKPNHSSGEVLFAPATLSELKDRTEGWLNVNQADHLGEWAYSQAKRVLILEERIPGPSPLIDYKVLTFNGEPKVIQVHHGRFGSTHTRTFYDTRWNKLPVRTTHQENDDIPRPENLEDMLEVARVLAEGWEFIRLDLYSVAGQVWLGEYSPYPCGGVAHFVPESFDRWLGDQWQLPSLESVRA